MCNVCIGDGAVYGPEEPPKDNEQRWGWGRILLGVAMLWVMLLALSPPPGGDAWGPALAGRGALLLLVLAPLTFLYANTPSLSGVNVRGSGCGHVLGVGLAVFLVNLMMSTEDGSWVPRLAAVLCVWVVLSGRATAARLRDARAAGEAPGPVTYLLHGASFLAMSALTAFLFFIIYLVGMFLMVLFPDPFHS